MPEHRSRLISAVTIEPDQVLETRKIVPLDVWTKSNAQWGDRWPYSMAVLSAANIVGPPFLAAHDVIPAAYRSFSKSVNRMTQLIVDRVERGGDIGVKINPIRYAPNLSDLYVLLMRKWTDQRGRCSLCGGHLATGNGSSMMQPSADRIDSANGAYDDENVWITHLACNLAKVRQRTISAMARGHPWRRFRSGISNFPRFP